MVPQVTIKSAHGSVVLEFCDYDGNHMSVSLRDVNCHGTSLVCMFEDWRPLDAFFEDLAKNWRGWQGKKTWRSMEDELALSATIDLTGHVSLLVNLKAGQYSGDWGLSTTLLLEAGQLEQTAKQVREFLHR